MCDSPGCEYTGEYLKDNEGKYCPRCGYDPDNAYIDTIPDVASMLSEEYEEALQGGDYVGEQSIPQITREPEPEPEPPINNYEETEMVKKTSRPVKKKTATVKKKAPVKKAASSGNGPKRGEFLRGIDEILQREVELQKKKLWKKMKTDEALNNELDKYASKFDRDKHQGVAAYRNYYNASSKGMGTTRKASDLISVSRETIDRWLKAQQDPAEQIKARMKQRAARKTGK